MTPFLAVMAAYALGAAVLGVVVVWCFWDGGRRD